MSRYEDEEKEKEELAYLINRIEQLATHINYLEHIIERKYVRRERIYYIWTALVLLVTVFSISATITSTCMHV